MNETDSQPTFYGVRSVSIIRNAHRETPECKHTDSQMCTEQFTNIFGLKMHKEGFKSNLNSQMHAERFTSTFQSTQK